MKKIALSFFLFTHLASFAQNGLYLEPFIGMGLANASRRISSYDENFDNKNASILAYQFGANLHFEKNNFGITSGLGFLRTGAEFSYIIYSTYRNTAGGPPTNYITQYFEETNKFNHLIVPLVLSYRININKDISIVPQIGVEISRNLSMHYSTNYKLDNNGGITYGADNYKVSDSSFFANYNKLNTWMYAALNIEYKIRNNQFLFAGFAANKTILSINTSGNGWGNGDNFYWYNGTTYIQKNYSGIFNLGVEFKIRNRKSPVKK